jgi:parallel beta-helix repeat protein
MNFKKNVAMFSLFLCITLLLTISIASNPVDAKVWEIHNDTNGLTFSANNFYIQQLIDFNVSDGDTLLFVDTYFSHISLSINKALNIISNVGTKIIPCHSTGVVPEGSDYKTPFVIINTAAGTNISGFNIENDMDPNGYGILVNNSTNVNIENNKINSIGNGIKVKDSSNITIKNNTVYGSVDGVNVTNSNNTNIINNKITNNTNGAKFSGNTTNTLISKNNISENKEYGITFQGPVENSHKNVKINYNYINSNELKSGIHINSTFPNMNISSNMISNNGRHGIYMDLGSNKTGNPIIEYNYILGNRGFNDFQIQRINSSDEDRISLVVGYNFYGASTKALAGLCSKTTTGLIITQLEEVSNGIYKLSYKTQDTNIVVKEMIDHNTKIYLNNYSNFRDVLIKNGVGTADFRESIFKTNENELFTYIKFKDSILIKDSSIPKKSMSITSKTNLNKIKNGDSVQYTVTVINNGDKKIRNLNINKIIPNFNVNKYTLSVGTFNKQTGLWTIPNLNPGQIANINIFIKPTKANKYKTTPTLTGDGFNLKSTDLYLTVEDYVKIAFSSKAISKKIKKNKIVNVVSKITNSGTKSSPYIKIKVTLSSGLKLLSNNYLKNFNKKTKTWTMKIPAKKAYTFIIKVKGLTKGTKKAIFNVNGKKQTNYLKIV